MTTTPWSEARDAAIARILRADRYTSARECADQFDAALTTLSRLGWRLVPAEATQEMVAPRWAGDEAIVARGIYELMTKAGDVLAKEITE